MKPGIKSTELYVVAGTIVGLLTEAAKGYLPPAYSAIAVSLLGVAYAALRTYLKVQTPPPTQVHVVTPTSPTPGA